MPHMWRRNLRTTRTSKALLTWPTQLPVTRLLVAEPGAALGRPTCSVQTHVTNAYLHPATVTTTTTGAWLADCANNFSTYYSRPLFQWTARLGDDLPRRFVRQAVEVLCRRP